MSKTKQSKPLRGEKLLKTAINQILKHPETWDQGKWHSDCGTKHCLAGWCQILAGKPAIAVRAKWDAMDALEISWCEADYLFYPHCTLPQMYHFAENLSRNRFDREGVRRKKQLTPFDL